MFAPDTRTATIPGHIDSLAIAEFYRKMEVPVDHVEELERITARIRAERREREEGENSDY
jgi:hypothetical protein